MCRSPGAILRILFSNRVRRDMSPLSFSPCGEQSNSSCTHDTRGEPTSYYQPRAQREPSHDLAVSTHDHEQNHEGNSDDAIEDSGPKQSQNGIQAEKV